MTDRELMQQALNSLEGYARNCQCQGSGGLCDAGKALRTRLAQPDLAEVGAVGVWGERQWQGLTDEEIGGAILASEITLKNYCSEDKQTEYARAIEAKLKEKNT